MGNEQDTPGVHTLKDGDTSDIPSDVGPGTGPDPITEPAPGEEWVPNPINPPQELNLANAPQWFQPWMPYDPGVETSWLGVFLMELPIAAFTSFGEMLAGYLV